MSRIGILVSTFVGLVLAVVEAVLLPRTISIDPGLTALGLLVGILGALAAGVAGRVILGTRRVHNYYKLSLPVLSAVAGFALASAITGYLIAHDLFSNFAIGHHIVSGSGQASTPSSVIVAGIVGIVLYLSAAVVYGFAGTKQGVPLGARIGLLVVLLGSVLPYLNIIAFGFWIVVSVLRDRAPGAASGPDQPAEPTPGLPAASE